jgi:2-iminobutanoate/2-iminopropanoate deaminase
MKKILTAQGAPAAIGPYSHGVFAGDLLFASGQIPLDPATGNLVEGGVEEQTEQCMKNVGAVLAAAGLGYDAVVKTTVFITNMADFPKINAIYGKYFPENSPARSCVEVAALPKGALLEVEIIALTK